MKSRSWLLTSALLFFVIGVLYRSNGDTTIYELLNDTAFILMCIGGWKMAQEKKKESREEIK